MAPSKRKGRSFTEAPSPKRHKRESKRAAAKHQAVYTEQSDTDDTDREWKAKSILQERYRNGSLQYLIEWDCIDPETGDIYQPEWQPAACANEPLVASWLKAKSQKEKTAGSRRRLTSRSTTSAREKAQARAHRAHTNKEVHSPTPRSFQPARKPQRVVESSPEPDTPRPSSPTPASSIPAQTVQSSEVATRKSPRIQIAPKLDFQPGEFDAYSQIVDSRRSTQYSDIDSSQLFAAPRNNFSSGIVPDSQSSAGEASYVLTTQETGSQQQNSHTENQDDDEEEEEEEDSGLLDIDLESLRTPSPAPSIPETIPDTQGVDCEQSQRTEAQGFEQERELVKGSGIEEQTVQTATPEEDNQGDESQALASVVQQAEGEQTTEEQTELFSLARGATDVAVQLEGHQEGGTTTRVDIDETTTQEYIQIPDPAEYVLPTVQVHATQEAVQFQIQQKTYEFAPPKDLVQPDQAESLPQFVQKTTSQFTPQTGSQEKHDCATQEDSTSLESVEGIPQPARGTAAQSVLRVPDESTTQEQNDLLVKELQAVSDESFTKVNDGNDCAEEEQLVGKDKETGTAEDQGTVVQAHGPQSPNTIGRSNQTTEQLASHSVSRFPFHSQPPLHDFRSPQQPTNVLLKKKSDITCAWDIDNTELIGPVKPGVQLEEVRNHESRKGAIISGVPHSVPLSLSQQPLKKDLGWHTQLNNLPDKILKLQSVRSPSPSAIQSNPNSIGQTHIVLQSIEVESVEQHSLAPHSQPPRSTGQSTQSREQNAQIVQTSVYLSTQEDATQGLFQTAEAEDTVIQLRSSSRHDSSQETPERSRKSTGLSSSSVPQLPNHSLGTFDSNVPPRLTTPVPTSSASIMASQDTAKAVEQNLKDLMAKKQAENPFTPSRRRLGRATMSPAATVVSEIQEGTRSPSAVPDRAPVPRVQTSLRTVVSANSRDMPVDKTPKETATILDATAHPEQNIVLQPEQAVTVWPKQTVASPPEEAVSVTKVKEPDEQPRNSSSTGDEDEGLSDTEGLAEPSGKPVEGQIDDEELSDADDSESLLNDDLSLERDEYIVPLSIDGRQSSMLVEYITQKKVLLEGFLDDPMGFVPFAEVVGVLEYLKAIETHVDLVFAEAQSTDMYSTTQVEHAAQFGLDNSVKFRFLHTLFHNLRDHQKHIVLVIEKNNEALFSIIETFCRAKFINYGMPTKGKQADPTRVEGDLLVTILSSDESPIIRAADLVICLDGVQRAEQIRRKTWSAAPGLGSGVAPIIHLVIPRAVGHVERYISSGLGKRERVHTILASLAQMRGEIGKAVDEDTPRATIAAAQVADWLVAESKNKEMHWPLPSIGSVKDVIEFQTQMSQASMTASPAPERTKRPLDNEDFDSAKRMRFTPQRHVIPAPGVDVGNEVTHVSDSMPGTAVDEVAKLQEQVARLGEAYRQERAARKAAEQRFREHEAIWDKQQTIHENQARDYRVLVTTNKSLETKFEKARRDIETLRERLASQTSEIQILSVQLEEQRKTSLLDEDEKIIEITRLRKDYAQAQVERERALKSAQTSEDLTEYTKEQYRTAKGAASIAELRISSLEAENTKLAQQASGEAARLKGLHHDRYVQHLEQQLKSETASSANLKKILAQKEEENLRLRNAGAGRVGVGTRASSATPQPTKTRSRAASPLGGRLSSLRNG